MRPARPPLRDRRRGRLDPHRRGPDAADHQRPGRADHPVVPASSPRSPRGCGAARTATATTRSTRRSAPSASSRPASRRSRTGSASTTSTSRSTRRWSASCNNALKAKELFKKDKDYVVMNGEVLIVDEFTGRILAGRRYNEGMHQAIEAKEGVQIKDENQTLATITLQNYFRLYDKLAGMTGTAMTEAAEFNQIYKLGVVPIPTNMPMIRAGRGRRRLPDRAGQVRRRGRGHRRAARGTASRSWSARSAWRSPSSVSQLLKRRGIPHEVLNAKYHEQEATIVAQAGRQGRGHRRDEHGRPRHRHHARRQPRVHRRPRAAPARPVAGRHAGGLRGGLAGGGRQGQGRRWPRSTRRSSRPAASTCSAPSGTSPGASTTSCAAGPAARATRASPGSTCRSRTT